MSEILLSLEILIFLTGFVYIFRREKIFGLYYFFLFLYAIVAQLGYMYISELSVLIKAYFGEDVWYPATVLILSSFAGIFIVFSLFWRRIVVSIPFGFSIKKTKWIFLQDISLLFLIVLAIFQAGYLVFNFENINWYTNQDEDFRSSNIFFSLFLFSFKFAVAINVVLYCIVKDQLGKYPKIVYAILSVTFFILFALIATRLGNRTDFLALGLGIMVYHLYRDKFKLKQVILTILMVGVLGFVLYFVEANRYNDEGVELDVLAGLMTKDYYAPAHILFAAVHYAVIDPIEVLLSNLSNALILIGYPYLQFGITELFNPGVATRSAGYAFYIFTEGYMVAGIFGFIYNAFVLVFGVAVWKKFATTNNRSFNNFLLGLMGCMLVNLVRGQSSYFIKYFYTFIIPGALLYVMLTGYSLGVTFKLQCKPSRG